MQTDTPRLDDAGLRRFADQHPGRGCSVCRPLESPAWMAFPASFDAGLLRQAATLADADIAEPTFEEWHPAGTRYWDVSAPISARYFPANRCTVWTCVACGSAFLRYVEYGGYYIEERVRSLRAGLIAGPAGD